MCYADDPILIAEKWRWFTETFATVQLCIQNIEYDVNKI